MITYYQTLHYGKGAIVKSDTEISGPGIKEVAQGKYKVTPKALKGLAEGFGVFNDQGVELKF